MKKSSAVAGANIALTKYWGRKDEQLRLPENGSIAVVLDGLTTHTTVEFSSDFACDTFVLDGQQDAKEEMRVSQHLDRVRTIASISHRARVASHNTFPTATGLSSSSSGFAALTVAASAAAGLSLSARELSLLARQASGSACRSIPDGFVEWLDGTTSEESYALSLYPPTHWDIADVVAVVSTGRKEVSSSEGHKTAVNNPFFALRRGSMPEKNEQLKTALRNKDFPAFGDIVEREALELHAMMFTSGLIYLQPPTLDIMRRVLYEWRPGGLPVYFNINTGQDIHLFCERAYVNDVRAKLAELETVRDTIVCFPGMGARLIGDHLF